jgi:Sulfotransferase family
MKRLQPSSYSGSIQSIGSTSSSISNSRSWWTSRHVIHLLALGVTLLISIQTIVVGVRRISATYLPGVGSTVYAMQGVEYGGGRPPPSSTSSATDAAATLSSLSSDIDWTDPIFQRNARWGIEPVVIEQYRLLFFTVPKVACTTFKQLFRRIGGHQDWMQQRGITHDPTKNGLRYLGMYPKSVQNEYMTSPNWTRAIFVRDPLSRTLAAYMDKAMRGNGDYIKWKCCNLQPPKNVTKNSGAANATAAKLAGSKASPVAVRRGGGGITGAGIPPGCVDLTPYERITDSSNFPFWKFVDQFLTTCPDPHWAPQSNRIRPRNWRHINFVGHLETVREDARTLLELVGAWDEYGSSGWGGPPSYNQSIFETNTAWHRTSSNERMEDYYYQNNTITSTGNTMNVEEMVLRYYRTDYDHKLFNFTKPKGYEMYF